MTELDRVIYDIERCTCHVPDACRDCSKFRGAYTPDCMEQLLTDAMELLKKQKPEKVLSTMHHPLFPGYYDQIGICPGCFEHIEQITNRHYCGYCGKELIWDD